MEESQKIINDIFASINEDDLNKIIISNKANDSTYRKIEIASTLIKGKKMWQLSCYTDKQVFQSNVTFDLLFAEITKYFPVCFKQMNIFTFNKEISIKETKKGKILTNQNLVKLIKPKDAANASHNRTKNYILKEGMVIPPLVDMGVFTKEGKIVRTMYDKFKQINRFVEMVDDVLADDNKEEINIIDFGCGKSYLTFIMYYYIVEIRKKKANIVGLDLKKDVIEKCNQTAKKYGYTGLRFLLGDINGYQNDMKVDMVVTLHACDTATDYALYNAVMWNARYILSVPCCQHELNSQIKSDTLKPMMKYGLIKERMAALATDSIRGCMLEYHGYKTNLMEFVDMAHSPKNILIRAVKSNISKEKKEKSYSEARDMIEFLNVKPTIFELLGKNVSK